MKTLEELRKEKEYWDIHQKEKKAEFDSAKRLLKQSEEDVRIRKKIRNRLEREYKFAKKSSESLDKRIRAMPSTARRWGREHPGEMINALEGGKYN